MAFEAEIMEVEKIVTQTIVALAKILERALPLLRLTVQIEEDTDWNQAVLGGLKIVVPAY